MEGVGRSLKECAGCLLNPIGWPTEVRLRMRLETPPNSCVSALEPLGGVYSGSLERVGIY